MLCKSRQRRQAVIQPTAAPQGASRSVARQAIQPEMPHAAGQIRTG